MENLFLSDNVFLSDEQIEELTRGCTAWYVDSELAFYQVDGMIIVKPAPVQSNCEEAFVDQKIREAGFATEPHRQLIEELAGALRARMFECGKRGFSEHEYQLLRRAEEIGGA